nr:MAG TPA: hypothetical protein [Caudoviricetes sp.]
MVLQVYKNRLSSKDFSRICGGVSSETKLAGYAVF